jgi:DNA-binding PadR family transcriptional regulator
MQREIDARCGVTVGPGTLFGAIARLEQHALIEVVSSTQMPRAYRLTALGAETLEAQLDAVRRSSPAGALPADARPAR